MSVLLWDNTRRRRWDVCSAWHAPGPDFTTSADAANVNVELTDATDPCNFNISVTAMKKPLPAIVELRFLSTTEGYFSFASVSVYCCKDVVESIVKFCCPVSTHAVLQMKGAASGATVPIPGTMSNTT